MESILKRQHLPELQYFQLLEQNSAPAVALKIEKTAYGVGHKDHPAIPNLLRVYLGETLTENKVAGHKASLIESNIDDMNPEFYEYISEQAF